jgi:hypothetical protein
MKGLIKLIIVSQAIIIFGYIIHCHDVEARAERLDKMTRDLTLQLSKEQYARNLGRR